MEKEERIWYASYGSNLLESRFHCYLIGGQPSGAQKIYKGCTDKSLPISNQLIHINSEMYFAKKSTNWNNGAVAFIEPHLKAQSQTLGRMYLIKVSQFIEIVKQEIDHKGPLEINFKEAIYSKSVIIKKPSWYGCLIFLGKKNNHPIFTFTNEDILTAEINPPSKQYLQTIILGLKETYAISDKQLKKYLVSKKGIKNFEIENQLDELIQQKYN